MSYVKGILKWPIGTEGKETIDKGADYAKRKLPLEEVPGREGNGKRLLEEDETYVIEDHGYVEAEKANRGGNASMSHSFICLPVP